MPDFGSLLGQAQQMMEATQQAAAETVEGNAGGGAVRIEVNGRFEFHSVTI
jgi:DNA-binding protein YbaB